MTPYQFSWIYALFTLFMVIIMGYFLFLRNDCMEFSSAQGQYTRLQKVLLRSSSGINKESEVEFGKLYQDQNEFLAGVSKLLEQHQLSIKNFKLVKDKVYHLQFSVHNRYREIIKFIWALAEFPYGIFIKDFSWQLQKDGSLNFSADMLAVNKPWAFLQRTAQVSFMMQPSPFCWSGNVAYVEPFIKPQAFPLRELKLAGVFNSGKKVKALIATPTGQYFLINKGEAIGKEFARVIDINTRAIILRLRNQQQLVIPIKFVNKN